MYYCQYRIGCKPKFSLKKWLGENIAMLVIFFANKRQKYMFIILKSICNIYKFLNKPYFWLQQIYFYDIVEAQKYENYNTRWNLNKQAFDLFEYNFKLFYILQIIFFTKKLKQ